MIRKIARSYTFSAREVHGALIALLKAKDIPAPCYVGDTPTCKWVWMPNEMIEVEWTDNDEVEMPS